MPFQIIRNDITKVKADVIVNTANPKPKIGRGTDSAIYAAAGADALLAERRKIGDIAPGQAAATPAFALPAKHIIHTVGPVYDKNDPRCSALLSACYRNSLELAKQHEIHSIAFPAISAGIFGYPKDDAAVIALRTISQWLYENQDYDMEVAVVCFDREMRACYQRAADMLS